MSLKRWEMLLELQAAIDLEGGLRRFAKRAKVSPAWVSQVLSQKKKPGPKILKALGLKVAPERYIQSRERDPRTLPR